MRNNDSFAAIKESVLATMRASTTVARELGISEVTMWRWLQRGWLRATNIAGRQYILLDSLREFQERAANGEFAKEPSGAAGRSKRQRLATQNT